MSSFLEIFEVQAIFFIIILILYFKRKIFILSPFRICHHQALPYLPIPSGCHWFLIIFVFSIFCNHQTGRGSEYAFIIFRNSLM